MSLRSRIVLAVAAVFALVSAITGSLMLSRAEQSLQTAFDRATRTRANWLLSMVSIDPVVLPLPSLREQMRIVASSAYLPARELFRSPDFPNDDGSPRQRRFHQPGTLPPVASNYRLVTVESSTDQFIDNQVHLTLAVPDGSLQRDIQDLRWVFGLGWLSSLVVALAAGYGAAGWLLRPIKNLVGQAAQIGTATRIEPLSLPTSRDELYTLYLMAFSIRFSRI